MNTETKNTLVKSFIFAALGLIAILIILLFATEFSWITIVLPILTFTMIAQLFWDGFIVDSFLFFCRSFSSPFGLIFELSLDGIIWLLTVKLVLWIICGLLSAVFFIIGVIFNLIASAVTFPFALIRVIKE